MPMAVIMVPVATRALFCHHHRHAPSKTTARKGMGVVSGVLSNQPKVMFSPYSEVADPEGAAGRKIIYISREKRERDMLVEGYHSSAALRSFLHRLVLLYYHKRRPTDLHLLKPLPQLLADEVEEDENFLWLTLSFIVRSNDPDNALQMFNCWREKASTRSSEANFSRIIRLFCEKDFMREAVASFQAMETLGLLPSQKTYNAIIHGLARTKNFDDAAAVLEKMVAAGVALKPETYNGLIQAYGNHRMYDHMSKCVKQMKASGCSPDGVTYNILITKYAHGGLIERMERAYRTLLSEHMSLQPSARVAMLEAYSELGVLDKMKLFYQKVLKSGVVMTESLIRKLARAYIVNCSFSCLEDLGHDVAATAGRSDLVWCLLLLASACSRSRRGLQSVIQEMESAQVGMTTTFWNIIASFYLKVKDFGTLDTALIRIAEENGTLDLVTVGILFDAYSEGFDGMRVLNHWTRKGLLRGIARIETDELVLTAFGKGAFHKRCEEMYTSLKPDDKTKRPWRYGELINLAFGEAAGSRGRNADSMAS